MKTRIAIATSLIVLTSYGFCQAPNNNLPRDLYSYEIFNLTESRHFEKVIKIKRSMKATTDWRIKQ